MKIIGFHKNPLFLKNIFQYNIEPFKYKSYDHLDYVPMDNYKLYICEYGKKHIINTTIDWKKGYMKDQFVFSNPNSEFEDMENNTFITKYK